MSDEFRPVLGVNSGGSVLIVEFLNLSFNPQVMRVEWIKQRQ